MARVLSALKQRMLPAGEDFRTIQAGLLKGISMRLDLSHQTQIYLGLAERETFRWFRRLSKNIQTGLDIGACYGEYTLYLLLRTTAKKVYAFEPDARHIAYMKDHLRANGLENDERLILMRKYLNSTIDPNQITLDSIADEMKGPIFVKMDVDTAEMFVLNGATNFMRQHDVRWLIETHTKELEDQCADVLQKAGYHTKVIKNAWWRVFIPELRPVEHNRWMVAVKDKRLL